MASSYWVVPASAPLNTPLARPASCWPDHCFCEAPRTAPGDGWLRQPANAVSNVGFLLAALLVWRQARNASDRAYAVAVLAVGGASFAFHATLTFATQTADVLGMYLVATWFLLAIVARRRAWPAARVAAWYLATNAALLSGLVWLPALRRYVFAALVLSTVLVASPRERQALVPALLVLGVSFLVWTADLLRWWCTPDSLLQGHALWHLGSALAAWLAWSRFTRTASDVRVGM